MTLLQPSKTINNRYRLVDPLGAGGMGVVYLATDRLTGQDVALKQVTIPAKDLMFASRADTTDHSLALAQEFRTLASLRHPHIVSVLDYGFDAQLVPFFTMDLLVEAESIVAVGQKQPLAGKVELLLQMLQALAYLHRRGILHRDLKPGNVLVVSTADGRKVVKLLDFGLSLVSERSEATLGKEMAGTLAYMAPELFQGLPASRGADLYAFGMIAYEIFAGQYPFDKSSMTRLMLAIINEPPDLDSLGVSSDLTAVIKKLLAKTREERYRSATEVIHALTTAVGLPLPAETAVIRESFLQTATFVGRQAEMAQLNHALTQAKTGASSVWLIGAESGVGKSRLLKEFRIQAIVTGWQVFWGQAVAEGGSLYQLWQEIVPLLALNTELSGLEASVLRQMTPLIERIYTRPIPALPNLDDEAAQRRLLLTFSDILQRQQKPTLLLLEDLQWSIESLAPLKQILRMLDKLTGVMVVATYRRDERPNLPAELAGAELILLDSLRDEEVAQLSRAMLGERVAQRQALIALLQRETEGNAFFLVEIVRALAEEAGQLDEIADMALPTEQIVTGGITQLIRRRLNKVPPDLRQLLKVAAVAGRAIDLLLLEELAPEVSLSAWLSVCEEAAVLIVQENRWQFAHDKLREILLFDMSKAEQRQIHRQVAEGIAACYPDEIAKAAILAQHWRIIGDAEKERHYALLAGRQAVDNFANEEALTYLNRALVLTGEGEKRPLYDILRYRERVYNNLGNRVGQRQDLNRMTELANQLSIAEQAYVALQYAEFYQLTSDFDLAIAQAQSAIELGAEQTSQTLAPKAYWVWGMALQQKGRYDQANEIFQQGLIAAQEIGDKKQAAYCLDGLGFSTSLQGRFEDSISYHQQSLNIFREIGDRWGEGLGLCNLAGTFGEMGEYANSQETYEKSLSIIQDIGNRYEEGLIFNDMGLFLERQGQYVSAIRQYQKGLAISREVGNKWGSGIAVSNLAFVHLNQGIYEEAERLFTEALQIAREIDNIERIAFCLVGLGQVSLDQANYEDVTSYFQQIFDLDQAEVGEHIPCQISSELAQLYLRQGNMTLANQTVQKVVDYLQINPQFDGGENRMRLYRQAWATLLSLDRDEEAQQLLIHAANEIEKYLAENKEVYSQEMYLNQPHHKVLWEAWQQRHKDGFLRGKL